MIEWEEMTPEQRIAFEGALNADLPKTPEEWFEYCARLSPVEYDRKRDTIRKKLGIRLATLDDEVSKCRPSNKPDTTIGEDPTPSLFPVDGAALLDRLHNVFERFIVISEPAAYDALALWVVLTYVIHAIDCLPILAIISPEKRCGKTTLLGILSCLTFRPLASSNISSAALYRSIEKWHPTLLIDELDSFGDATDELRGILNSGHTPNTAFVIRCDGENKEPRQFTTWAPKVLALIGRLPGTLEDRSITISMKRRTRFERVERFRRGRFRRKPKDYVHRSRVGLKTIAITY
jgi:putative DNA primase/helicase